MRVATFGLLLATYAGVVALAPAHLQVPRKLSIQVVDLAPDGMVLARITPTPYVIASSDKPLDRGDVLTCTPETGYLDCGDAIVKPLGFVIHADEPDVRAQQDAPKQRSQ